MSTHTKTYLLPLFLFLVSLCHAQTHIATVTLFQNPSTSSVITKAFAGTSTTGDLIIVALSYDSQTKNITAVTDTKGNAYSRINGPTNWDGSNYRSELWYSYNITGGAGAISVTAKLSGPTTSFMQIYMSEYSGITSASDPLNQFAANTGNSAVASSGTRTLNYSNELLYAISIGASGLISTGTGFNARSTANQNVVEDKNTSPAGVYSSTFSCAGGNWVVDMASFKTLTSVLPVELAGIEATALSDQQISLNWSTLSEKNNACFIVERSEDGLHFEELSKVTGAGTSSQKHQYSFIDRVPIQGLAYYRLKQIDFDNSFHYSTICSVNSFLQADDVLLCYPNPAGDEVAVTASAAELSTLKIFNVFGQDIPADKITLAEDGHAIMRINLAALSAGTYYLRTATQNRLLIKR